MNVLPRNKTASRGSISAMVMCMVLTSITVTGMVYDGGKLVSEYTRLSDLTENAARLGAQYVTGIRAGSPRIDLRPAARAVREVLADRGVRVSVEIDGGSIVVSTTKQVPLRAFAIVGMGSREVSVTRRVRLVGG